jgi:CRP-like cAMP-binding protein
MAIPLEKNGFSSATEDFPSAPVRIVRDKVLFATGERRECLYLIEAGIIAQYRMRTGGVSELIEFVFAGDAVGFGYHENHTCGAQAVGEVRVRCLPLTALDAVLKNNKRALDRYAEALEREFNYRRDELTAGARNPLSRVATLLVAISELHEREGADPTIVSDSLSCIAVADWLGIELDALAQALLELECMRLIKRAPRGGIRLIDRIALGQFCGAALSDGGEPQAIAGRSPTRIIAARSESTSGSCLR